METSVKDELMDTDYTKHKHQTTVVIHSPKENYVTKVYNCT